MLLAAHPKTFSIFSLSNITSMACRAAACLADPYIFYVLLQLSVAMKLSSGHSCESGIVV